MNRIINARRRIIVFPVTIVFAGLLLFCQAAESTKSKDADKPAAASSAQTSSPAAEKQSSAQDSVTAKKPAQAQRKLVVYYFHTTFRCYSCNTIERLTKQAVESGFAQEIKSGRLEFRVINVESPGNEHFVKAYRLYTKSVILSALENGKEKKWKNLDQVWTLLRDQDKFIEYVQKEVRNLIQG
jgi:exo-beta-1,3-glucanase (GH17 family)